MHLCVLTFPSWIILFSEQFARHHQVMKHLVLHIQDASFLQIPLFRKHPVQWSKLVVFYLRSSRSCIRMLLLRRSDATMLKRPILASGGYHSIYFWASFWLTGMDNGWGDWSSLQLQLTTDSPDQLLKTTAQLKRRQRMENTRLDK